ncbi:hypothetical protein EG68_00696 [Paragonimus skrjabini miyazakii]|uniref:Uncharacterized protein n=1 Tax=Paragonimus skrjabini miyazakii TaxID=59628 RepID=A0A8S9Z8F6_9TREM|nr:hypothetical protein EG68_00696 [Paragonimus skrjabini miyazakii]
MGSNHEIQLPLNILKSNPLNSAREHLRFNSVCKVNSWLDRPVQCFPDQRGDKNALTSSRPVPTGGKREVQEHAASERRS